MKKDFWHHLLDFRLNVAIDLMAFCAVIALAVTISMALNLPGTINPVKASFWGSVVGSVVFFPLSAFLKTIAR